MTSEQTAARPFALVRYYVGATVLVLGAVLGTLVWLQRGEEKYFDEVQAQQQKFFGDAQRALAQRNAEAARAGLLAVHEAAHVNLARVMANTMWNDTLGPLVEQAQGVSIEHCRSMPAVDTPASSPAQAARRPCFAAVGLRLRELPAFAAVDRMAYGAMRGSSVFKIKVFDPRGLTIYSSEHSQVGEDAWGNAGRARAMTGHAASEFTHRERFSAFEGVVENRDLISSYMPVRSAAADGQVLGVLELYSDVTPFLAQIQSSERAVAANVIANEDRVAQRVRDTGREVRESSAEFIVIVGGLIVLLYAASLVVVFIGQRIIDRQTRAQQQAAEREQLWHREKMAALAAMVDNVAHEVGNPLAVIAGVAQSLPDDAASVAGAPGRTSSNVPSSPFDRPHDPAVAPSALILQQTQRIGAMMRKVADFASARSSEPQVLDVNALLRTVCEFQTFDRRFRRQPIRFVAGAHVPPRELVADHLNELSMGVLQALADVRQPAGRERTLLVQTARRDDGGLQVDFSAVGPTSGEPLDVAYVHEDPRVLAAQRRARDLGGELQMQETVLRLQLPAQG